MVFFGVVGGGLEIEVMLDLVVPSEVGVVSFVVTSEVGIVVSFVVTSEVGIVVSFVVTSEVGIVVSFVVGVVGVAEVASAVFDSFKQIIRTNSEIELNNRKFILVVGKQS